MLEIKPINSACGPGPMPCSILLSPSTMACWNSRDIFRRSSRDTQSGPVALLDLRCRRDSCHCANVMGLESILWYCPTLQRNRCYESPWGKRIPNLHTLTSLAPGKPRAFPLCSSRATERFFPSLRVIA